MSEEDFGVPGMAKGAGKSMDVARSARTLRLFGGGRQGGKTIITNWYKEVMQLPREEQHKRFEVFKELNASNESCMELIEALWAAMRRVGK